MNATSHLLSAYKRFWIFLKDLAQWWIWQCQVNFIILKVFSDQNDKWFYDTVWFSSKWKCVKRNKNPKNCLLVFHNNMYIIFVKVWFYYMLPLPGMNRSFWHNEFCFTFYWVLIRHGSTGSSQCDMQIKAV